MIDAALVCISLLLLAAVWLRTHPGLPPQRPLPKVPLRSHGSEPPATWLASMHVPSIAELTPPTGCSLLRFVSSGAFRESLRLPRGLRPNPHPARSLTSPDSSRFLHDRAELLVLAARSAEAAANAARLAAAARNAAAQAESAARVAGDLARSLSLALTRASPSPRQAPPIAAPAPAQAIPFPRSPHRPLSAYQVRTFQG